MKRIVFLVSLLVSLCALRAQDTINPAIPGLYYIDTSYNHIENYYGVGRFYNHGGDEFDSIMAILLVLSST